MKRFGNIRTLARLYGAYRFHLAALVALGFFGAILDGLAINIAIPSLSFLINPGTVPTDLVSRAIASVFAFFSVSFSFQNLIILIMMLLMLRAVAQVVFGYVRGWITGDFLANESKTLLGMMFSASWAFLLKQKMGYIQNTLERDMQRSSTLLEAMGQLIQSTTGFLMYLIIAFNISPTMTLFTLGGGVVLALVVRPLLIRTQLAGGQMAHTEKQVSQFVSEHIIGMKTMKAAAVEKSAYAYGASLFERLRGLYIRLSLTRSLSTSFFQPFAMVFVVILFMLTYHTPEFSLVAFAATLYLIQKIFTYLESGQSSLHVVRELIPYAASIDSFKRELAGMKDETASGTEPFVFEKEIAFDAVSFSHGEKRVLNDVSFAIRKGETVAIIGPSGAGKTSVADLLLRLFRPDTGRLLIDGTPAENVSLSGMRSRIGYVTQDTFLLNASIEDNIRFYRDIDDATITQAATDANLDEFVSLLPEGLATVVGDRGVMLSGGQRQRIALARALAGRPAILLLDEATSALDRESERMVQEAIRSLQGKITVIMIAHRLSTIEHADRVLVFAAGKIVEDGAPKVLAQDPNSYYARNRSSEREG